MGAAEGSNAGPGTNEASSTDTADQSARQVLRTSGRPQAQGQADWVAETQRVAADGRAPVDAPVADLTLAAAMSKRTDAADWAPADVQRNSSGLDAQKALEQSVSRDQAADSIAARYATMASAGLSAKDLQGPALDRLAIKDSQDILQVGGQPAHPRAAESKALVADSLKSDAYRAAFNRATAERAPQHAGVQPSRAGQAAAVDAPDQASTSPAVTKEAQQSARAAVPAQHAGAEANSLRSEGGSAAKRRAIPPLEDRFNVQRIGLVEKAYHFRDQAGRVAFTDKFSSITTASESPAAIKAMVDRAAERGWETVRLKGSPEFVRQGWIAATAQGLKAVGHTATPADQDAAEKERGRLQVSQDMPTPQRSSASTGRAGSGEVERPNSDRTAGQAGPQRQLACAIEKALSEGRVSPELRGQVRALMNAEGARRVAGGERFRIPLYDARAPRARTIPIQPETQRAGERERSR